jgi:hypothetical protein
MVGVIARSPGLILRSALLRASRRMDATFGLAAILRDAAKPLLRMRTRHRKMSRPTAYFSLIGGAIFSAGAGGNAGAVPVVCPAAPDCAGCGEISAGRAPVGAGSAGADGLVSAPGVDCSGCVACATCELATSELRAESWVSERPDITSPEATIAAASQKSL